MESTNPGGPVLPTQEALDILQNNAKAASERSRYATLVQAGQATNRDALRRDFAPRAPEVSLPGTNPVPADKAPDAPSTPTDQINNLIDQFNGSGAAPRRANFLTRGSSSPSTPSGPTQYQANPVQTFQNDVQTGVNTPPPQVQTPQPAQQQQAITGFRATGEYQMGSPIYQAIMGPANDARYNWFVGGMVNAGVVIPNVSASNIRRN